MTDPRQSENLRFECLRLAAASSSGVAPEELVKAAKLFADYIVGPAPSIITPPALVGMQ